MKLDSAVIYTNELTRAVTFYRDTLGLQLEFIQDGKFAAFRFENGAGLSIKQKSEEREIPGHQTVIITPNDIEEENKRLQGLEVPYYKELSDKTWGKEFSVQDPDGNKVVFVERITSN